MNKYKRQKMNRRNAKLEKEITNYKELEEKIMYLENLKMCTQSKEYKKQIDNNIKNIINWWKSKGNQYYEI